MFLESEPIFCIDLNRIENIYLEKCQLKKIRFFINVDKLSKTIINVIKIFSNYTFRRQGKSFTVYNFRCFRVKKTLIVKKDNW